MRILHVALVALVGITPVLGSAGRSAASASTTDEHFYVTGHVNRPGKYPLAKGVTVADGILQAGDYTAPNRRHQLTVRRWVDGRPTRMPITPADPILPSDALIVRNADEQ